MSSPPRPLRVLPPVGAAVLSAALILGLPGPILAAGEEDAAAGIGTGTGIGTGAWGEVPAPTDSTVAIFREPGMPLWEATLVWPYRVLTFPVKLMVDGVGVGVSALDQGHVVGWVMERLGPKDLPFGFRLNMTAGGLPGLGGGLTFFHNGCFSSGNCLELRVAGTLHGSNRASVGFRAAGDGGPEIGIGYRLVPNSRFFGIGPDTSPDGESFFTLQQNWAGISSRRSLGSALFVDGELLYTEVGARGAREEDDPDLPVVYSTPPPGFGRTSDGVTLGVSLIHDTVSEDGRPERGGERRIRVSRFEGVGDEEAAFWTYRAEAQQFLPLWFDKRALALRGFVSWIDAAGSAPIPFQRLMTNDDPDLLRGYRDFRWRDRGMAVLTAEYRWPIWAAKYPGGLGADAYLFADYGQVFEGRDDLTLDRLTESYGGGVRLLSARGFLARFEVGRSEEETTIRFRADQVFQYTQGDLFHGRNPIPDR